MTPARAALLIEHLRAVIGLTDANAAEVMRAFENEAARVVRSTPFSSSGMYPSHKNRAAIQRESRTGELPFFRLLEHDVDVIAYADQPDIPVKVSWLSKDGKRRHGTMTADVLVVRRDRAALVEVKTEAALVALANERPGYLERDPETGRWRCPSAEAYLAQFGLTYEIVTPAGYPQTLVRNLENLGAAFRAQLPDPATVMQVVRRVREEPGVAISKLFSGAVTEGQVHVLIAAGLVFVDLERDDLSLPQAVPAYPNRAVAEALATRHTPSFAIGTTVRSALSLRTGDKLTWVGDRMEVIAAGPVDVLLREVGDGTDATTTVPRKLLQAAWAAGELECDTPAVTGPHAGTVIARQRYEATGQAGVDEAINRYEALKTWKATGLVPENTSRRSLLRWDADCRAMEATTGDPFVGLCPLPRSGNTDPKVDRRVVEVIDAAIKEIYLVANGTCPANVAAEVVRRCREAKLPAPHSRTVQRRIAAIPEEDVVAARAGRKAAYDFRPFAPINPDAAAPNGDFGFSVSHADGTLLDLETAHPETGLPLGRAWLHRLVDGRTGTELARYIAYVEPSEAVVLELLWRCVVRWGVLALRLVVDLGPEHRGGALHACCLANHVEIDWRPKSRPRHGAPIECNFGTVDTDLLYQLAGNTQTRKNVRQETKEVNPTNAAIHSISWLDGVMEEYNEIIGKRIAAHLGEARLQALKKSLAARAGSTIPYIAADERLRFLTMAPVEGVTRRLHPVKGFMVGRQIYFDEAFRVPPLAKSERRVRSALGDPSWVLVEVGHSYLRVASRSLARTRVTSANEISDVAAISSRTGTVAAASNKEVKVELAGLAHRARETATAQRKRLGETEDEQRQRLREEENQVTRQAHAAAGTWTGQSALETVSAPDRSEDDPYAYAWEEPA